jgi:hypothetical protein
VQQLSKFAGDWNKGVIAADCTNIVWKRGGESVIKVDGKNIVLSWDGKEYAGKLGKDRIEWDDGDVWIRTNAAKSRRASTKGTDPKRNPIHVIKNENGLHGLKERSREQERSQGA